MRHFCRLDHLGPKWRLRLRLRLRGRISFGSERPSAAFARELQCSRGRQKNFLGLERVGGLDLNTAPKFQPEPICEQNGCQWLMFRIICCSLRPVPPSLSRSLSPSGGARPGGGSEEEEEEEERKIKGGAASLFQLHRTASRAALRIAARSEASSEPLSLGAHCEPRAGCQT